MNLQTIHVKIEDALLNHLQVQTKNTASVNKIASLMHMRQYRDEYTSKIEALLVEHNCVAVFGASDDLIEFVGALEDEFGVCNGGSVFVSEDGLFEEYVDNAREIKAVWCGEPGISWTYETDIPHSTFVIMEDDDIYCRGIVFCLDDIR